MLKDISHPLITYTPRNKVKNKKILCFTISFEKEKKMIVQGHFKGSLMSSSSWTQQGTIKKERGTEDDNDMKLQMGYVGKDIGEKMEGMWPYFAVLMCEIL